MEFKSKNNIIYIPLWSYSNVVSLSAENIAKLFTFHYGPIQMMTSKQKEFIETVFTFHYGPIQIKRADKLLCKHNIIYIPLWSYSNLRQFIKNLKWNTHLHSTMVLFKSHLPYLDIMLDYIYIPLWSYSNKKVIENALPHSNLHSTMVLFKFLSIYSNSSHHLHLHSTMVLFK